MGLEKRFKIASEYLSEEIKINEYDWITHYESFKAKKVVFPKSLILVHPNFYLKKISQISNCSKIELDNIKIEIQGKRIFDQVKLDVFDKCSSKNLWGYSCNFKTSSLHKDHEFPYSKGGPTSRDNLLLLCKAHNELKGIDIHFWNWESGYPVWFDRQLNKIKNYVFNYLSK